MSSVFGILALTVVAAPSAEVRRAVSRLGTCEDLGSGACLDAARTLADAGADAVSPTVAALPEMRSAAQLLALGILAQDRRYAATSGLARIATDRRLPVTVRALAIEELSHRFDGRPTQRLVDRTLLLGCEDANGSIRAASVRALGNRPVRRDKRRLQALLRAASDPEVPVRTEAVLGLGMTGTPSVGRTLVRALRDPSPRVRTAAADGLTFVKAEESIEALVESLRSEDPLLRRIASEALVHQTGHRYGEDYGLWQEWLTSR